MATLVLTTTANDDGMENATVAPYAVDRTSAAIGFGNNTYAAHVFLRFALPSTGWLDGKILTSFQLAFTVNGGTDASSFKQKLYMELKANPAQLAGTNAEISLKTKASTSPNGVQFGGSTLLNWNVSEKPAYSQSGGGNSLLSFYQAMLVDAAALGTPFTASSIAALGFIFEWDASGSAGQRVFNAFEFGSGAPELTITYFEPDKVWDKTVSVLRHDYKTVRG